MKAFPEKIYLLPDAAGKDEHLWCEDAVQVDESLPSPIEYVRADLVDALKDELNTEKAHYRALAEHHNNHCVCLDIY